MLGQFDVTAFISFIQVPFNVRQLYTWPLNIEHNVKLLQAMFGILQHSVVLSLGACSLEPPYYLATL